MATLTLTPELEDLAEHEKVIEQGLSTFFDVGYALAHIRDGKKYRAAGYKTFEAYCNTRWELSRRHAYQLIASSEIAERLCSKEHILEPAREGQMRPLAGLDEEERQQAWEDAVARAEGGQPTAAEVEAAVRALRRPAFKGTKNHPARFSDAILAVLAARLQGAPVVLDPFAGTGRVHELRELAGVGETIGIEIERWEGMHPENRLGSALNLPFDDGSIYAIATSPTYGNRLADHHNAQDDSVRNSYTHTLGRTLHPENSGALQWGDEYRAFHLAAWAEAIRVLSAGGLFVLNIKDHIRDGKKQEVAAWHLNTLTLDLDLQAIDVIPTKGTPSGEHNEVRTSAELVFTLRKPYL